MKPKFSKNDIAYVAPYGLKCYILDKRPDENENSFQYLCSIHLGTQKIMRWLDESLLTRDPINFSDNSYLNTALKDYFVCTNGKEFKLKNPKDWFQPIGGKSENEN